MQSKHLNGIENPSSDELGVEAFTNGVGHPKELVNAAVAFPEPELLIRDYVFFITELSPPAGKPMSLD
ncbi:hypothetical protein HNY73_010722 [Argiope bruennichi]|uniref:Uncharacterized protein n=1 Tax=Argiope bruennichi TaxID=94029 RepID=A0A8T0F4E3_ARGBR|nr:hypothetical protein HNY73_010722 [Argiope bruennichi]